MRHHRRGLELAGLEPDREPSRWSNSRSPPPSRTGTTWTVSSSTKSAPRRYCCAVEAPPPIVTSFPSAAAMVWNGGSSPHQPLHSSFCHGPRTGPNMLRPMIVAPTFSCHAATCSSSAVASPPSRSCCSRKLRVATAHSWSTSPPLPSGSSMLWSAPATYPSSDIVMWILSFDMPVNAQARRRRRARARRSRSSSSAASRRSRAARARRRGRRSARRGCSARPARRRRSGP